MRKFTVKPKTQVCASKDFSSMSWQKLRHLAETTNDPSILNELIHNEDPGVRVRALHQIHRPELYADFVDDESEAVREVVAREVDDPNVLAKLADDSSFFVRVEVARRTDDPQLIAKLANDKSAYVRTAIAARPVNPEILAKLANDDEDEVVRETASKTMKPKSRKSPWTSVLKQLEADCEKYGDPLYEQTEAGEYIQNKCIEVENSLGVWIEPSVQAGTGGVWIYSKDDDTALVEDYDYQTFNDGILDLVVRSSNLSEFKKKYKAYLKELLSE